MAGEEVERLRRCRCRDAVYWLGYGMGHLDLQMVKGEWMDAIYTVEDLALDIEDVRRFCGLDLRRDYEELREAVKTRAGPRVEVITDRIQKKIRMCSG